MIISVLLPLLLLSGLGYLLSRYAWFSPHCYDSVNLLTTRLLVPCLLFTGIFKNGLPTQFSWMVLASFYLPLFLIFLLISGLFTRRGSASLALSSVYCNTVFVGVPVLMRGLGEASLQYAFPVIAFHSLTGFSLYYWAHGRAAGGDSQLLQALARTIKNPIVISLMLGLLLNRLELSLPPALMSTLTMLSNAALPCALLVLGASLSGFKLSNSRPMLAVIILKLVMMPIAVLLSAHYLFHLPQQITAVLVTLAACPIGVNAYAVVQEHGSDASIVSSAILGSSLAAIISLPLWLHFLARLGS